MHLEASTTNRGLQVKIEGLEVAENGTGQWRNRNMELNLAWFIGFAPLKNPKSQLRFAEGVIPRIKFKEDLLQPQLQEIF